MKDSLHLLNSDSEQNITGPERKPIRCGTHKFKLLSDRLPAAFPPTDFVLQCFRLVNLVSSVQVLRNLKEVEPSQFSVSGSRLRRPLNLIGKRYGVTRELSQQVASSQISHKKTSLPLTDLGK